MVDTEMENTGENHEIAMTSAATTIDPNVVQSRILQSSSLAKAAAEPQDSDDEMNDGADQPVFAKLNAMEERGGKVEYRRVRCPKHRYTPLRNDWEQILMPLVQFLKLQVSHYTRLGATFIWQLLLDRTGIFIDMNASLFSKQRYVQST
jgi:hypothetical protein